MSRKESIKQSDIHGLFEYRHGRWMFLLKTEREGRGLEEAWETVGEKGESYIEYSKATRTRKTMDRSNNVITRDKSRRQCHSPDSGADE